jgi:hypothetical protein
MKTMFYKGNSVKTVAKEDIKKRIMEDPEFVKCAKYGNSLTKFLSNNKDNLENSVIARLLMLTEQEVEDIYKECVDKLRDGVAE